MRLALSGAALLLIAAAPAPDRVAQLQTLQALDLRVATIAWRLSISNTAICARRVPQAGLVLQDLAQFSGPDRAAAKALFGLGDVPAVSSVVKGGAAEWAGLQAGDAIVALNGGLLPAASAKNAYARIAAIEAALDAGPVALSVERRGERRQVRFEGRPGCASRVQIVPGRGLNAHSDGTYVQLTTAVAAEAADDDELAAIIAHEMAHNILGHSEQREREGGGAAKTRAREIEADRFSVRMLKGAGFDPHAAARFWARFGKKTGAGIFSDGTHQRTKDRVAMLEAEANAAAQ